MRRDEVESTVHSRASSLCPPEVQVQEVQAERPEEGYIRIAAPCNAFGGRVWEA
jgi:hypothetical protein